MIKRGRPKGATAYPETAVCVKCGVFRPKRRGFCDRCRPRNRGAAAKNAANMASASAIASPPTSSLPSSPSSAALPGVKADDAMAIVKSRAPHVAGKPRYDDRPEATNKQRSSPSSSRRWVDEQVTSESRGVKRQHQAVHTSGETSSAPQAQIRGKRRRTVSAPAAKNNITNTLPIQAAPVDRNRNVDVVSSYAAHGAIVQGKDRKLGDDSASWSFSSFTASPAAHQLALLLPRSDGTAVDVVTLQYLQSASPTATVSSSPSPALASHGSSPTSSPSVMSSAHSLMSLANVSALAASRYPSPSSYSSSSSPASSPPRSFVSWSAFSSPESSLSPPSSFVLPLTPSSKPIRVRSQSKAGDLMLPSLGSLALPRPALPRSFYQVQTAAAGLHLESMVAPSAIRPN